MMLGLDHLPIDGKENGKVSIMIHTGGIQQLVDFEISPWEPEPTVFGEAAAFIRRFPTFEMTEMTVTPGPVHWDVHGPDGDIVDEGWATSIPAAKAAAEKAGRRVMVRVISVNGRQV
jgi:hypothetical protein